MLSRKSWKKKLGYGSSDDGDNANPESIVRYMKFRTLMTKSKEERDREENRGNTETSKAPDERTDEENRAAVKLQNAFRKHRKELSSQQSTSLTACSRSSSLSEFAPSNAPAPSAKLVISIKAGGD